jgi:two-component system NtrC family sensor kinase
MNLALGILARKRRPLIITDVLSQLDENELDHVPVLREHESAVLLPMFEGTAVSSVILLTFDMIFPVTDVFTQNIIMGISNLATMTLEKIRFYFEQERIRTAFDRHERLVAMGHLIAGVAHEVNNPLSIMQLDLDELRSHFRLDENTEAVGLVDSMQEEIARMTGLVRQLKDFARSDDLDEVLDDQSTDINEVFKSYPIKILLKNISRKKIAVKQELKAGRCSLIIPRNKLLQVVMNLLVNADEALENIDKGTIRIVTRYLEGDLPDRGTGIIEIRDNGAGIGSESMPRIFDPFYTTKQATGTGLGLSISYTIINAHGGEITVESCPESGTVFTILLPAVRKKSMLSQIGRSQR